MVRFVLLFCAAVLALPVTAQAQALAGAESNSWDLAASVTVNREPGGSAYHYGWNGSVSQRPYPKHPWVGGTIEGSGVYASTSSTNGSFSFQNHSNVYTAMAGPMFSLRARHAQPFAHVLLGGVVTTSSYAVNGSTNYSSTDDYFGHMIGGGVDLPFSHHVAARTQADWFRVWQDATVGSNSLRLTGGIVYSF